MTLILRAARPSDVDAVVPLMHESSRALIDATFGRHASAVLRRDFLRGKGIFGYRYQIVGVEPDGGVAATLTAYPGRRYRRLALHTLCSAGPLGPVPLTGVVRRTLAVSGLFAPPARDGLFLANICVAAEHRGRGYGSMLIQRATAMYQPRVIELDVSFANTRAQRLYERLGYKVTRETPAPPGSGLDGFRRMTRDARAYIWS
jgi:ribosomal protein S18 acetylase RimI-like enzyme